MANAKRDDNQITTLIAVSNVDGITPVVLYADPTTHRLLVSAVPAGGLSGTKVYYVADSSGDAVTRKLTFVNGILTAET